MDQFSLGKQLQVFHRGKGFFINFTAGSFFQGFSCLKISSGQAPMAPSWFDGPPAQKDPTLPFWNTDHHNLGTLVKNPSAGFTGITLPIVSFGDLLQGPGTAFLTVFHLKWFFVFFEFFPSQNSKRPCLQQFTLKPASPFVEPI